MFGMQAPKTFQIFGTINHHQVTILVDDGNTHNFVQLQVANFLDLPFSPIDPSRSWLEMEEL